VNGDDYYGRTSCRSIARFRGGFGAGQSGETPDGHAARQHCRADAAPDQVDAAPQASGEADNTADYTGFSMVGVAG